MSKKPADSKSAFFVGYLKMPKRLGLFYWAVIPVVIGCVLGAGFGFAVAQKDPGQGRFMPPAQTLTGYFDLEPYPVLRTIPTDEFPESRTVMLTGAGKFGILDQVEKHKGQMVDVRGVFLVRGDHEIFQVGGRGVKPTEETLSAEMQAFTAPETKPLGSYTLKGEIVDSKCYLGAMRPGEGKTHMVCANVCIMGGVPPMFVIYDEKGVSDILMLADEDGKSLAGLVSDYTSLFVSIAGQVEQRGDLKVFRIDRNSISVL